MLDIQLGRRNLSPIQRIAVAEKYRPIYERRARENQIKAGIEYGNGGTKLPQNIGGASNKKKQARDREVNSQLAKIANVNPETYRQAKRNPTTSEKLSDIAGVSTDTYSKGK